MDIVKLILNKKSDPVTEIIKLNEQELEQVIQFAAEKYHTTSKPVIDDAIYDILIDFLTSKNPKSKVLKEIGAKLKTKNKVKLDYWLGSMDKIKPPSNQLSIYAKKYEGPYNLSDKLDGISALLVYTNNNKISMFTRGTADEGMDISHLIKYLNLPSYETVLDYCTKHKIKSSKNLIAFRGELIIKDETFKNNWLKQFKNARNTVAGLVNSKKINPNLANDTDLVLYEIVDPFFPIEKQLQIIEKLGFNTVTNKTIDKELSFTILSKYLKERREKSIYQIDGIIVTDINNNERNKDGNPEYAFAYKNVLEDQIAVTTVLEIDWTPSKDGYINPTLILKPVSIGGVEIKRVTAFNAKYIVDNVIGKGAELEILRSGDVIPYINKVLKPSKSGKPDLPNDLEWHWNETKVDIILDNLKSNKDVLIKNLYFFFSTLDTKGLGEKNIEKLIDAKLDSINKILDAKKEDFLKVEGFKEKSASNLVESIKKALTNIPLCRLMAASNKLGHGLGEERIKNILSHYPNLLTDYKKWSKLEFVNNIIEIDGFENKTSSLFVSNFNEFIKFYESIKKYVTFTTTKKVTNKNSVLSGKTIVLSGFRDKELQEKIEENGGKVSSSVSKNTDYLVVKDQTVIDDPTEKINKAKELNVIIMTKDKFQKLF